MTGAKGRVRVGARVRVRVRDRVRVRARVGARVGACRSHARASRLRLPWRIFRAKAWSLPSVRSGLALGSGLRASCG